MSRNNKNDSKGQENERRVDHLVNLVEKKTRTQRHLEEHSDISSSRENVDHARQIQENRQQEIDNLKNILAHGDSSKDKQLEDTEKRFVYTEGYLNHNAEHMDEESFRNAKERQEHRKEQMDSLK